MSENGPKAALSPQPASFNSGSSNAGGGGGAADVVFKTSEECRVELIAHTVCTSVPTHRGDTIYTSDARWLPVTAARASFQREDKTGNNKKADLKLMGFLAREEHLTPFEHLSATFVIECPLFIRSQILRHRTFSYSEWSRRYTDQKIGFWAPSAWRKQSKSNKQCSSDEVFEAGVQDVFDENLDEACRVSLNIYRYLIDVGGVSREQARAVLPQSLLTQFVMSGNLRNWSHFLNLRKGDGAQEEVKVVARKIEDQLRALWPEATEALL